MPNENGNGVDGDGQKGRLEVAQGRWAQRTWLKLLLGEGLSRGEASVKSGHISTLLKIFQWHPCALMKSSKLLQVASRALQDLMAPYSFSILPTTTVFFKWHWPTFASPMAQAVRDPLQCKKHKRHGFNPWVRKIPWRRKWQPTPVFLPGKSRVQRGLADYSSWDHKESEWLITGAHTHTSWPTFSSKMATYSPFPQGLVWTVLFA